MFKLSIFEALLFQWVANKNSVCVSKRVAASDNSAAHFVCLVNVFGQDYSLLLARSSANSSDAFDDQVCLRQSASLVKATDVNFASEGNSKRFGTKDLLLNKLDDTVVDSHAELHRELWGHNVGNNQDASEHDLVARSVWVQ